MSNDTSLDMCVTGLYHTMQATALERALELIADVGDAKSKAIASVALGIVDNFEELSEAVHAPSKGRTAKAKVGKVSKKSTKSRTRKVEASKADSPKAKEAKVVLVAPSATNGSSLNGNADSAKRLLDWRKKESLSQKKAAERVAVSVGSWQAWESGKWPPSAEMIRRLEKIGI